METTFIELVGQSLQVFMFASFLALLVERLVELLVKPAMPESGVKYIPLHGRCAGHLDRPGFWGGLNHTPGNWFGVSCSLPHCRRGTDRCSHWRRF